MTAQRLDVGRFRLIVSVSTSVRSPLKLIIPRLIFARQPVTFSTCKQISTTIIDSRVDPTPPRLSSAVEHQQVMGPTVLRWPDWPVDYRSIIHGEHNRTGVLCCSIFDDAFHFPVRQVTRSKNILWQRRSFRHYSRSRLTNLQQRWTEFCSTVSPLTATRP